MGAGDSAGELLGYASKVFGELFETDAIVTEDRLSAEECLQGNHTEYIQLPDQDQAERLRQLIGDARRKRLSMHCL